MLLRLTAVFFGLSGLALLIWPVALITTIGLTSSRELIWSFQLIALLDFALAAFIALSAAFLGERGLRQSAVLVMAMSVGTVPLVFFMPGGAVRFLWLIAAVLMVLACFFALQGRRRNR